MVSTNILNSTAAIILLFILKTTIKFLTYVTYPFLFRQLVNLESIRV
jgi:hypothetical protein